MCSREAVCAEIRSQIQFLGVEAQAVHVAEFTLEQSFVAYLCRGMIGRIHADGDACGRFLHQRLQFVGVVAKPIG
jgi:hypothetical protein